MITDIPKPSDFRGSGTAFLNLAWTAVVDLYLHTKEEYSVLVDEPQLIDDFWMAAQGPLSNAAALLQQGIEFLIKSRIVRVSPFLLIDRNPREWPRKCDTRNTPFSEFRTLDAQDLVKVHDTVRSERLEPAFVERIAELRGMRNTIMHTVDKTLRIQPVRLLVDVLDASHNLLGRTKWVALRRRHLDETPESVAFSTDFNEARLIQECMLLPTLLSRAEIAKHLDMSKSQRWYICSHCAEESGDAELRPKTAQLKPNSPASRAVLCFVCRIDMPVTRHPCAEADCRGNVIDSESRCLTCYTEQQS